MVTDDFLGSLPDDPELAFIELVDYLDKWLAEPRPSNFDALPDYSRERKYADNLRGFADEYDLEVPFRNYDYNSYGGEAEWWDRLSGDVTYIRGRYPFRHRLGTRMRISSLLVRHNRREPMDQARHGTSFQQPRRASPRS